jgi:2',3'-cyclic-nucleotide 2'-phosphodiesterase (5'-nucleotidase family)
MKRIAPALAAAVLAACSAASVPAPATQPLRFLLINDVYLGDTLRDGSGGLARVASLRDSLAGTGPVTFVLAGDFLSPSLLTKWYRGEQMRQQLNAAKLDYATFGNHEFEIDRDTLISRIANSTFKWTNANCFLRPSGQPFPGVSRWDTATISGVKVGVFGVTLAGDYRSWARCSNPDSAARVVIGELKSAGAQLIYGLTHQNLDADSALLAREPDVDFILGGHEHENHRVLVGGRRLLKADANSRSAQLLTVRRRPDGRWVQGDQLITIDRRLPFEPTTQAVVKAWTDSMVKRIGPERVIAATDVALDARDEVNRSRESPLGDIVTDAVRLGTGADVAIMNSGTMRLDDVIPAGPISNYQVQSIFLFPDESRMMTFPLTGARLREILEHGVSRSSVGRGPYLQVSGVKFTWDASKPDGSRIVGDLRRNDGSVIAPNDTLRVSFGVYPACEGGDGYVVPEAKSACDNRMQAPPAVELVLKHITERLGGRVPAPEAGRVTRVN